MEKKHDLTKEEYVVSLLGFKLEPYSANEWIIRNQEGEEVGHTRYETLQGIKPSYRTSMWVNGVTYDDNRPENTNDRYFHYVFHGEDNSKPLVEFIMNYDKEELKEIQLWYTHPTTHFTYLYDLFWNPSLTDACFLVEKISFEKYDKDGYGIPEKVRVKYNVNHPNVIEFDGPEYECDILNTAAVDILGEMDQIIKNDTFFAKSFEEIIGKRDVAVTGMDNVLDMARQINAYREENTQMKR